MTSAIPVQCSTNGAIKLSGSWSYFEFVMYPKMVKNKNKYMKDLIYFINLNGVKPSNL